MDEFEQALEQLKHNKTQMKETLVKWANINSGSYHLDGLKLMHDELVTAFSKLDGEIQTHESNAFEMIDETGEVCFQKTGNLLTIKKRWHKKHKILLCGHMDTVFSKKSSFQTVKELKPGCLNGPGVADMKGGLVVMLHALLAFEQSSYANAIGWQVMINADEEIGSLGSATRLEKESQEATLALVYEPSMTPEGVFAGARKGSGKFTLIVEGIASHAGRAFYEGRNAICHLAALICDINLLNDPSKSLTINVGLITGGTALNVVPDKAIAKCDVRFNTKEDKVFFETNVNKLIKKYSTDDGYQVTLHGGFSRPAKPLTDKTLKLFHALQNIGKQLNLPIDWQPSGGCCDGNNLAAKGLAVIDTLGVRGGNIHSDQEFMWCDSLLERSQLSALLLMTLAQGSIKDFE